MNKYLHPINFTKVTYHKKVSLVPGNRLGELSLTCRHSRMCIKIHFNRDLNRGCLVYMFSLRFSGGKFLTNLRRQFSLRIIFSRT